MVGDHGVSRIGPHCHDLQWVRERVVIGSSHCVLLCFQGDSQLPERGGIDTNRLTIPQTLQWCAFAPLRKRERV